MPRSKLKIKVSIFVKLKSNWQLLGRGLTLSKESWRRKKRVLLRLSKLAMTLG